MLPVLGTRINEQHGGWWCGQDESQLEIPLLEGHDDSTSLVLCLLLTLECQLWRTVHRILFLGQYVFWMKPLYIGFSDILVVSIKILLTNS